MRRRVGELGLPVCRRLSIESIRHEDSFDTMKFWTHLKSCPQFQISVGAWVCWVVGVSID